MKRIIDPWSGVGGSELCLKNLEVLSICRSSGELYESQEFKVYFHQNEAQYEAVELPGVDDRLRYWYVVLLWRPSLS